MNTAITVAAVAMIAYMLWARRGDLTPARARELVASGARLVDVRTRGEYASGHIDGAINIPVSDLSARVKELGAKDRPVVLYCASGARSARGAALLKSLGFTDVHNLGAMSRW